MRLIDADAFKKWLLDNSINEREIEESKQIGIWLDAFPTANQWIPCSKEMPKIGKMLVSNGLNVVVGEYYGDDVWVINGCEAEPILEEIAWMPLSEPWKEGNNDVE